jgi:hypothetical protein
MMCIWFLFCLHHFHDNQSDGLEKKETINEKVDEKNVIYIHSLSPLQYISQKITKQIERGKVG